MKSQYGGHDGHVTAAIAALVDDVAKLDTVESWQDLRVDVADLLSQLGATSTLGQHTVCQCQCRLRLYQRTLASLRHRLSVIIMSIKVKGNPYSITKRRVPGADPGSWQSACR